MKIRREGTKEKIKKPVLALNIFMYHTEHPYVPRQQGLQNWKSSHSIKIIIVKIQRHATQDCGVNDPK